MGINRYKEVLEAIRDCGKIENDVLYYGYIDGREAIKFDEFKTIYNFKQSYNNLNVDKVIVFKDGSRLVVTYYNDYYCDEVWEFVKSVNMNPKFKDKTKGY